MKKQFEELKTKRAQKMRIVQDAINQINIGQIIAGTGNYFTWNSPDSLPKGKFSIQKALKADNKCQCCAKGALFAACVIETNKVNSQQNFRSEYFQKEKLSKWFSAGELDTIECAFEKGVVFDTEHILRAGDIYSNKTSLGKNAIKFGKRYKTNKERLLKILENIKLNGSFKP